VNERTLRATGRAELRSGNAKQKDEHNFFQLLIEIERFARNQADTALGDIRAPAHSRPTPRASNSGSRRDAGVVSDQISMRTHTSV
jgi:hypothetical protein